MAFLRCLARPLVPNRPFLFRACWLFLAALAVQLSLGADQAGAISIVEVNNGRGLAAAFANSRVLDIVLLQSITLLEDDWSGLGELPLLIQRNVTVTGNPQLVRMGNLPVLNGSFVKDKLQLASGVTLNLTGFVMTWYREDLPSTAPGIDLLTNTNSTGPAPLLLLHNLALYNRICFPEAWAAKSVNATRRPDSIPGVQNTTGDLPQLGCRNESTGPWLSRCYAVRRKYVDTAAYGAVYGPAGNFVRTGYLVYLVETDLLCADIMTGDCIDTYGALGCYYSIFPRNKPSPTVPQPLSAAAAESTPAAGGSGGSSSGGKGGAGDSSPRRRTVLIAVLCATLGAAVLGAAAVATIFVLLRDRQLRGWLGAGTEPVALRSCFRKARPKERSSGRAVDEYGWSEGGCCGDTQQTICLDVMAPAAAAAAAAGGGALPLPLLVERPPARGKGLSSGGEDEDMAEGERRKGCQSDPMAAAYTSAYTSASGGGGAQQQRPADPEAPVTLQTPPRCDVHMLADPFQHVDNEVKLLPNATRGSGSFGRVVEGVYQGRRVAVKLVADVYQWGGPSESLLRSFAQEVEVLCRCTHPNIVRLLAACLTPPRVCLVMELMETSLERLMYPHRACRPAGHQHLLPLVTVLHVSLEISMGLEYLHPTIVHRDLKPANVLVNNPDNIRPVVKLTDFGVSRLRSTEAPTLTPGAGTPAYLAPEGLDSVSTIITHKADIYSLAVMVWEMLAGERPWRGCNLMEMAVKITFQGSRPPLHRIGEYRCPPKLRSLIKRCWDADPRRRPAAAEVAKSLALILQEVEANGGVGASSAACAAAVPGGANNGLESAVANDAASVIIEDGGRGCDGCPVGGSVGGPPAGRGARVLAQQVPAAATISRTADAGGLASGGDSGGSAHPQQPPPPLPPHKAPRGCFPGLGPTAVAIGALLGMETAPDRRGMKDAAGGKLPLAGVARRPTDPRVLAASAGSGTSLYAHHGGPGACTVGFLGSSAVGSFLLLTVDGVKAPAVGSAAGGAAAAPPPPPPP